MCASTAGRALQRSRRLGNVNATPIPATTHAPPPPLFPQTLTHLTQLDALSDLDSALLRSLHDAMLSEVSETGDYAKVVASVPVFVAFLALPALRQAATESVLLLLLHPWPRIRARTAQQFFEFVIATAAFVDDDGKFEQLTEWLSGTPWDAANTTSEQLLEGAVGAVCALLGASLPTRTLNSTIKDEQVEEADFGYDALVNEVGY